MRIKSNARTRKRMQTKPLQSPEVIAQIVITLFAVLPVATGLLVARWFGWGVDGSLFGVMTGGITVALLLLVALLRREPHGK